MRPVLQREAMVPRHSWAMMQKQLGTLGMIMIALFLFCSVLLTTAFVLYPPQAKKASAAEHPGAFHVKVSLVAPPGD